MKTESKKFHTSFLRSAKRAHRGQRACRAVLRGLADPLFPVTFFRRNMVLLMREPAWRQLPLRARKNRLLGMLRERSSFFMELKNWLEARRPEGLPEARLQSPSQGCSDPFTYCDHCGGCCEIASGLPEFPPNVEFPSRWRRLFGSGLGVGHRFCGFLWENNGSGQSLCAIHPWRPIPCRTFEREECEHLKQDADFIESSNVREPVTAYRRLLRLMKGR